MSASAIGGTESPSTCTGRAILGLFVPLTLLVSRVPEGSIAEGHIARGLGHTVMSQVLWPSDYVTGEVYLPAAEQHLSRGLASAHVWDQLQECRSVRLLVNKHVSMTSTIIANRSMSCVFIQPAALPSRKRKLLLPRWYQLWASWHTMQQRFHTFMRQGAGQCERWPGQLSAVISGTT